MRTKLGKRIAGGMLAAAVAFSGVFAPGIGLGQPTKVEAANGQWVLTAEKVRVGAGYGSKAESERIGDGSQPVTSGLTADSGYERREVEYAYQGKIDGNIRFLCYKSYKPNNKPLEFSNVYTECTVPKSSYAPGETVNFTIASWVKDQNAGYGDGEYVRISLDGSYFKDSKGETRFSTGVADMVNTGKTRHDVTNTMPSNPSAGSSCKIYGAFIFGTGSGDYEWTYTFQESSSGGGNDSGGSSGNSGSGNSGNSGGKTSSGMKKGDTFWTSAGKFEVTGSDTAKMLQPIFEHGKTSYSVPATAVDYKGKTRKITAVGASAFSNVAPYMTKLTIGKNVKSIGNKAFFGSKKLNNITIITTKLTNKSVGAKAFGNTPKKCKAKVPKQKLKAYTKLLKNKGFKGIVKK